MDIKQQFRSLVTAVNHSKLVERLFPSERVGGLEINADSLKLAYLSQAGSVIQCEYFASHPLPAGVILNGEVSNTDALAIHIKQLYDSIVSSKKLGADVVVSIPESNSFTHQLKLPAAIPENIVPSVIMNNAMAALPFNLSEIYDANFAWQTVSIEGLSRRVILCLAKRNIIERYQQAIELAGLRPIATQTPTLDFEFVLEFPKDVTIIYFLENTLFTAAAYLDGKLLFKRTAAFQDHIPQGVKFSFEALADLIAKNFPKVKDFILTEIGEHHAISLLLVSALPGMEQIIGLLAKKNLKIENARVKALNVPNNVSKQNIWPGLFGAALRGLLPRQYDNFATLLPFSPREQYIAKKTSAFFSRTTKIIFTALLFYIVSFLSMGVFLAAQYKNVSKDLARSEAILFPDELSRLEEEVGKFNTIAGRVSAIQENLQSILPALQTIEKLPFQGVALSQFGITLQKEKALFSITGNAPTREQFLAFKENLETMEVFQEISIPLQTLETRENINFTITFSYGG